MSVVEQMSHTSQAAVELHDAGFIVTLCEALQKNPRQKAWQHKRYQRQELIERCNTDPNLNLGLQVGEAPNLIDIEIDGDDGEDKIRELFEGEPPETFTAFARRGPHRFFRYDKRLAVLKSVFKIGSLEFRVGNDKACQSVVYGAVDIGDEKDFERRFKLAPPATLSDKVIERILAWAADAKQNRVEHDDWLLVEDSVQQMVRGREITWCAQHGLKIVREHTNEGTIFLHLQTPCPFKQAGDTDGDPAISITRDGQSHWSCRHANCANKSMHDLRVKYAKQEGKPDDSIFTFLDAQQHDDANYKREFLIEGCLVAREPMLVGGSSKTLKTSMCLDACVSLASQTNLLGKFKVLRRCRVAIMSGESGGAALQETSRRICKARGLNLRDLKEWFYISEDLPQAASDSDLHKLSRSLAVIKPDVLFIDPAYLCLMGEDSSNVGVQGPLLRRINLVCVEHGVTLIIVHHCKKAVAKKRTPPTLEDMSMAGFSEFARQWWLIGRYDDYQYDGIHELWFVPGGSAGHQGLWIAHIEEGLLTDEKGRRWKVSLRNYIAIKADLANAEIKVICDLLDKNPNGMFASKIVEDTGLSKQKVDQALKSNLFVHRKSFDKGEKPNKKRWFRTHLRENAA